MYRETSLSPLVIFLLTVRKVVFLLWIFFSYVCLCHIVLSVSCSLLVTCWERADLLALLYVMFSCVFVTLPFNVLGQVWYLIVLIPVLCLLPYFVISEKSFQAFCTCITSL